MIQNLQFQESKSYKKQTDSHVVTGMIQNAKTRRVL